MEHQRPFHDIEPIQTVLPSLEKQIFDAMQPNEWDEPLSVGLGAYSDTLSGTFVELRRYVYYSTSFFLNNLQ